MNKNKLKQAFKPTYLLLFIGLSITSVSQLIRIYQNINVTQTYFSNEYLNTIMTIGLIAIFISLDIILLSREEKNKGACS